VLIAGTGTTFKKEMKTIKASESTATWTGKKIGGSHTGTIKLSSGTLELGDKKLTGGNFIIDMSSITVTDLSGDSKAKLEGHLKSEDFFSTEAHPKANLVFTNVKEKSAGVYTVTADLTIKEKTDAIVFDLTVGNNTATTQLVIDRSKYDVRYGSKSFFSGLGDNLIYDNFEVDVKLVF
jgi:polyisoprenoid-binding protein YceI